MVCRVSFYIFYGFSILALCTFKAHPVSLLCEFQTIESNIPYILCMYDAFVMYNEEQCKLWSISCATYKLIVPCGPHLAQHRLC